MGEYERNRKRLLRFIALEEQRGYVFACTADKHIRYSLNKQMQAHLQLAGKQLSVLNLTQHKELTLIGQIDFHVDQTKPDVLVIQGIEELLVHDASGELTQAGLDNLIALNAYREYFHRLNRPIVFWINRISLRAFGNIAVDLFTQRRLSTLFFEKEGH